MGCGDGIYTLHMSALAERIAGVDYAPSMIRLARRYQESLLENKEFKAVEVLPTIDDFALYLSRIPGYPNYTAPEAFH